VLDRLDGSNPARGDADGNPRFSMMSLVIAQNVPWYSGVAITTPCAAASVARSRIASSVAGAPGKASVSARASMTSTAWPRVRSSSAVTARARDVKLPGRLVPLMATMSRECMGDGSIAEVQRPIVGALAAVDRTGCGSAEA
jgi:hypothetical protein